MTEQFDWRSVCRPLRAEAHFGDRVVDCFSDRPRSLYGLLQAASLINPDGEALVSGGRRFTWQALDREVTNLASGLTGLGLAPGERVAMLIGNHAEFVLTLFATARLGAIAVPMSTRMQGPEITYIVNDCAARLLVHDVALADRIPAPGAIPSVRHVIGADRVEESTLSLSAIAAAGATRDAELHAPAEEDTAIILYTSGTTGRPKGAMLSHLGIIHSALVYCECMQLGRHDRTIAAVPLSHVTGIVAEVAAFALVAGTLVLLPEFKADAFLALAAAERMTHTVMVPAMYNLCLLSPRFGDWDLSAWRIGGYGGASMPVPTIDGLARKLPGLRLMNAYGATETTSPVILMPPHETRSFADYVGRPVPGVDIRVMDPDGREVPPGEVGEVWIKGASVVRGYWNNPEATGAGITGGYWHSGDLGRIGSEGHLAVLDRVKDMINRGGYKIFTAEVETVLAGHPGVVESAVIARPCPVLGERVHAVVVAKSPDLAQEDLRKHCSGMLSDYKVPETFEIILEPLPRNAGGKVLKRELRNVLAKETS